MKTGNRKPETKQICRNVCILFLCLREKKSVNKLFVGCLHSPAPKILTSKEKTRLWITRSLIS